MKITEEMLHVVGGLGVMANLFTGVNPNTGELYFECIAPDESRNELWWQCITDTLFDYGYNFAAVMVDRNHRGNIDFSVIKVGYYDDYYEDVEQWRDDFIKEA